METILITGCSSGYGLETARHFHANGWNVIATMRKPQDDILPKSDRLRILPLDVTRPESIAATLEAAGPIDVLVNNAGIGLFGAFEATPMERVRAVFETNTFGTMAVTQAAIPAMRRRGSGVIVNVTSSSVFAPFPLVAVYTASKTAIEGFTGVLAKELGAFGLRVKLVEPGYAPSTQFSANSDVRFEEMVPEAYAAFAQSALSSVREQTVFTRETDVAEGVWRAVHDTSDALRFPAGPDSVALAEAA